MIFTAMAINLFYQFWLHSELIPRLPNWFSYVFNTPVHHKIHHASNIRYLDRNHGGMLIIWDRLFGSFADYHDGEMIEYGLTENITRFTPIYVATHEYQAIYYDVKRAPRWQDKLKYIFYSPGWSHDGEDKRSDTLRSQLGLS